MARFFSFTSAFALLALSACAPRAAAPPPLAQSKDKVLAPAYRGYRVVRCVHDDCVSLVGTAAPAAPRPTRPPAFVTSSAGVPSRDAATLSHPCHADSDVGVEGIVAVRDWRDVDDLIDRVGVYHGEKELQGAIWACVRRGDGS